MITLQKVLPETWKGLVCVGGGGEVVKLCTSLDSLPLTMNKCEVSTFSSMLKEQSSMKLQVEDILQINSTVEHKKLYNLWILGTETHVATDHSPGDRGTSTEVQK